MHVHAWYISTPPDNGPVNPTCHSSSFVMVALVCLVRSTCTYKYLYSLISSKQHDKIVMRRYRQAILILFIFSVVAHFRAAQVQLWSATGAIAIMNQGVPPGHLEYTSSKSPIPSSAATALAQTSHEVRGTSHRLWLHVDDVSEGMANWRIAVVELLLVAKQIGAAFVEPCIVQGRVTSCHKVQQKQVKLGDVFDLNKLREIHPWIISQEVYEATTANVANIKVFVFCMHDGNPSPAAMCLRGGERLANFYNTKANSIMEQALQQQEPSIIEIHTYRKGGFAKTLLQRNSQKLLNSTLVEQALENNLHFHSKHYEHVARLLRKLNIQDEYHVIHWRAELLHMNYPNCAEQLIKAKNIMSKNANTPTILISSLNQNPSYQWGGGGFTRARSAQALRSLTEDHGFLKLDRVNDNAVDDMIYLAVWDQIASQNATNFATCTKACKAKMSCKACNYQGSFGEVAIRYRDQIGRTSLRCWPTK